METPKIDLPTRDVLAVVSHRDQRMIKWFEDLSAASLLIGTAWIRIADGNAIETGESVHIVDLNG